MSLGATKQKHFLTLENIDGISGEIQNYLKKEKVNETNIVRIRLAMEEILLRWRENFGEDIPCFLSKGGRFGRRYVTLSIKGEECNPLLEEEEEPSPWLSQLMVNMGLAPSYSYQRGNNQIQLLLNKQGRGPVASILIAIVLAFLVGVAGQWIPSSFRTTVNDLILNSVYTIFLGMLTTIAGPMIFLTVIWGICGIGDVTALGKMGKNMFLQFVLSLTGITFLIMTIAMPFYSLSFSGKGKGANGQGMAELIQMIEDIFPKNFLQPFIDGNTMQIIVIAIALGVAMLVLGKQVKDFSKVVEQSNQMIQYLMGLITKVIPVFVFVLLVQRIWSGELKDVIAAWKLALGLIVLGSLVLAMNFIYVSIRTKVSMKCLAKKMLPAFLIALTTNSSAACFSVNTSSCEEQMGISPKLTKFGIPLGTVIYMPASCIMFICSAYYVAGIYDVTITPMWFILSAIFIVILSIALPPVPGGALTSYTVLFSQLGLPRQALAVVLTLDIFLEFFITATHIASLQLQLILLAKRMDLLDADCLRAENFRQ